jgi:hypothetical protein
MDVSLKKRVGRDFEPVRVAVGANLTRVTVGGR